MSTYYFLVCERHKEFTDAASLPAFGQPVRLGQSNEILPHFIHAHHSCGLVVLDEHRLGNRFETHDDWEEDTLINMLKKKRD